MKPAWSTNPWSPKLTLFLATVVLVTVSAVVCADSLADGDAAPKSFVVRAKTILPVAEGSPWRIDNGVMIVRDGRIAAIGTDLEIPADLSVIEYPHGTIVPGFVAAASELGGQHRGDESIAAGYRAADAIDLYGENTQTLAEGVTTVHVNPGTHRLLTGQGAVAKLGGPSTERMLRESADLAVNLGPNVNNPPDDVTYPFPASADVGIEPPIRQRPASRMGQLLALDEAIQRVNGTNADARFTIHTPALADVWKKGTPLRFGADRTADLLAAIRFLAEKSKPGYVVGGAEAHRVADTLRKAKIPLVYRAADPFRTMAGNLGTNPDTFDASQVALDTFDGVTLAVAQPDGQPLADLRLAAIQAGGAGLDARRALEAITRTPAEILGVDDRVGSLAPGKDADFLVMTGDPLEVTTHVERTYIAGRCVFQPPQDGPLVIKAETVWLGPGKEIQDGQVLAEDGKIVAVGRSVPHPPFARVLDMRPGGFVTPGLIDAHGHLGLQGDRSSVGNDTRYTKMIGVADVTDLRVARAGITTVMMAPYSASSSGSPIAAIKTAGTKRAQRVLDDPAAVMFNVRSLDPTVVQSTLERPMAAGKAYLDSWTKYEKALEAFEKKQKETATAAKKPDDKTASKEAPKSPPAKKPTAPDPLTGTWEATITDSPMPAPITMTIEMQLLGTTIEGRVTRSSLGHTGRLTGTLDEKHISATFEIEIPGIDGYPKLEADLDKADHFQGKVTVMGLEGKIEGKRTDKKAIELVVERTRKKPSTPDGRPQPPKVNPALEPIKAILEKRAPAVVDVATPVQIREVLAVLVDKYQIPLILLNADGASIHAKKLAEKNVTVVVPTAPVHARRVDSQRLVDYVPADDLSRAGVPIAFQSSAEDGARNLPAVVQYAVGRGLDADRALEGLTIGAAKAYKIDDRVGTLESGKDADLVIFSNHPMKGPSRVLKVIVDGKEVQP